MLMDSSSGLVHSLLPIFMATTFGASMVTIGIVGVREPDSLARFAAHKNPLSLNNAKRLRLRYWLVVALGPAGFNHELDVGVK